VSFPLSESARFLSGVALAVYRPYR